MNTSLLLELFKIGNSSGNEQGVSNFIKNYFDKNKIHYEEDIYGNIYNLKNKNLPVLNAHMDSVQDNVDENLAKHIKIREGILNGYGVIGGDDKCGIFVILEVLKQKSINFILTVGEEIGCVGISNFMTLNSIKDYPWALTLDRYGSGDIICESNDYGTKEFENALFEVGKNFGYKPARGVFSDADHISEDVSCANISVGYYAHHTKNEYVVLSELQNSINFVISAISNIKGKFEAPKKFYSQRGYYEIDDNYDLMDADECLVTGKKSSRLVYLPSLNGFVSPEGAQRIFDDLEGSGILYETYKEDYDIDEILRDVI